MALGITGIARVIENEADIRDGVRALRRACPAIRRVHDAVGDPPLRRSREGLGGLLSIVVAQQVSAASADAIWRRTEALIRPMSAKRLLALDERTLAGAGLSRPKIATLKAVAQAIADRELDLSRLAQREDGAVREHLTAIRGIGPWTADIYLMFCLGRADSWAAGDLALQIATQQALGLRARPGAAELEEVSRRWQPWRGVAARLLWAYHTHVKSRAPAPEGASRAQRRLRTARAKP